MAFDTLGYTPFIREGRHPKSLLVYRQTAPGAIHTRPSMRAASGSGDAVEILSKGRQFVVFGEHPDTKLPYRWIGEANPLEDTPADAPIVLPEQIEAFLVGINKIMPLAAGGSTERRRTGTKGGYSPRAYNAEGKVTDGRESLLRDCTYQAAHECWVVGDPWNVEALYLRAWELFGEQAWLEDQKWSIGDAMQYARQIVRRLREGAISFEEEPAIIDPFYGSGQLYTVQQSRDAYHRTCVQYGSNCRRPVDSREAA